MHSKLITRIKALALAATLLFGWLGISQAQSRLVSDVDRRAGPRATFQKPLAADIADHTVLLEGILFSGAQYLFDDLDTAGLVPGGQDHWEHIYGGLIDLRIVRKLANTYSYGFDGRLLIDGFGCDSSTETRYDVFIRSYRGTLSYGNYADRNILALSARDTLSGEANLFYDGFFAPSNTRAFRYRVRLSSFLIDAAVDDDGENWNAGFLYRSPSRYQKDSWAFHYYGGDYLGRYMRHGITGAYQISYGSLDLIANVAWDTFDPYANFATFDRVSASLGASFKFEATTLSAGVLIAETNNGDLETAYTAGLRHDLARGLSLNFGYLYLDSNSIGSDGLGVTPGDFSGVRSSVTYRF
ncbi:MAG: hypothetical protein AAF236_12090 [Verrucomicrobiota bacterium]